MNADEVRKLQQDTLKEKTSFFGLIMDLIEKEIKVKKSTNRFVTFYNPIDNLTVFQLESEGFEVEVINGLIETKCTVSW